LFYFRAVACIRISFPLFFDIHLMYFNTLIIKSITKQIPKQAAQLQVIPVVLNYKIRLKSTFFSGWLS